MMFSSDENPWGPKSSSGASRESREGPKRTEGKRPSSSAQKPGAEELMAWVKKQWQPGGGGGANDGGSSMPPRRLFVSGFVVLLLIWLASGFYTVKEAEHAVVLRFGAYVRTMYAGLHFQLPYPIEEVIKKNVAANNYLSSEERGLLTADDVRGLSKDERDSLDKRSLDDFYMLTGDENLVELNKYTILWRIKDLRKFLFNVRSPRAVIMAAADSSLREVIAKTPINLIITERRAQVNEEVAVLLQELLDHYDAGIQVVEFLIQRADPPEPVLDAFLDVTRAEADRERAQHEARAYRDEVIPKARARAKSTMLDAEGYSMQVVAASEGEAGRFLALYEQYRKAPEVIRRRLYIETVEQILQGANKIMIDSNANGILPHLPLDKFKPLPAVVEKSNANATKAPKGEAS